MMTCSRQHLPLITLLLQRHVVLWLLQRLVLFWTHTRGMQPVRALISWVERMQPESKWMRATRNPGIQALIHGSRDSGD